MNNYSLEKNEAKKKVKLSTSLKKFSPFLKEEKSKIFFAVFITFITSGLNLVAPILVGYAIDNYIQIGDYHGVLVYSAVILGVYIAALITNYIQTLITGKVGQNLLFSLRNSIFSKLEKLPIAFFNQNKSGDLISRINNDTDKLNQFFSQSLVQFIGSIVTILGAAIFMLSINWHLGLAAITPAIFLLLFTKILSPWIKRSNAANQKNLGLMSAEISESVDNFKVVVAFDRRDYFREKFNEINEVNYKSGIMSGIANNTLTPAYGLVSNIAQLLVLTYGITLISYGSFTIGLLVSFISYVIRMYDPLRQIAALWSSFQTAFVSWDRIHSILILKTDLIKVEDENFKRETKNILEFKDVSFSYNEDKQILHSLNLSFERGKIYALVGPTGGGKTTTASLIARLYDPTEGAVLLDGKDIRSFDNKTRTDKIGFILQEPFLFDGNLKENIIYGNEKYKDITHKELEEILNANGLEKLFTRFENGLDTKISSSDKLSLGQKQLIAFIRAVLRKPELIILDEATANIDTVTEQILEEILEKLPTETTLIVIAHRLNTIENADEIYFVNAGKVVKAGDMEHAVDMLLHGKRES